MMALKLLLDQTTSQFPSNSGYCQPFTTRLPESYHAFPKSFRQICVPHAVGYYQSADIKDGMNSLNNPFLPYINFFLV
jgi:hypothetical protein